MGVDVSWRSVLSGLKDCRPKQGVEIYDVFTYEVMNLALRVRPPVIFEIDCIGLALLGQGRHISDRSIHPNVEVFAGLIRDFKTEIGCISGNIPVL